MHYLKISFEKSKLFKWIWYLIWKTACLNCVEVLLGNIILKKGKIIFIKTVVRLLEHILKTNNTYLFVWLFDRNSY